MRALTVRQPWAWAIVHGGKDVENRTQAWNYRGPLAIHAAQQVSARGLRTVPSITAAERETSATVINAQMLEQLERSAIIGIVELVDVHVAHDDCCESWWAERDYQEAGGRVRREIAHLMLEDPRPLEVPIPARGRLGLWTPEPEVLEQLQAVTR